MVKIKQIKQNKLEKPTKIKKKIVKPDKNEVKPEKAQKNFVLLPPENKAQIDEKTLKKALKCLINLTETNPALDKQLFNEQFGLFLQINTIKHLKVGSKILRLSLDHSLYNEESDVCLIVPEAPGVRNKDLEKHWEFYENLLKKKGVKNNIKKFMTLYELRTEYDTFELKKRLVDLYDCFLVDGKIAGKAVGKLGSIFYEKRKVPNSVKLNCSNLEHSVTSALRKTQFQIHDKGNSFMLQFGHNKMSLGQLKDNVLACVRELQDKFPGGFDNIRSLNLKAHRGPNVPIYVSLKSQNDVEVIKERPKKPKAHKAVQGELSTMLDAQIRVRADGSTKIIKNKVSDKSKIIKKTMKKKIVKKKM